MQHAVGEVISIMLLNVRTGQVLEPGSALLNSRHSNQEDSVWFAAQDITRLIILRSLQSQRKLGNGAGSREVP